VHSGDPDTTLGNTWRTLVIFHYMLEKDLGLNQSDFTIRSSGDDVDIYIRKGKFDRKSIVKIFTKYFLNKNNITDDMLNSIHGTGMMMKMVNIYEGVESESCSTFCFMGIFGDVMVIRQPHRMIKTLSFREEKNNQLNDEEYTNAVSQCNYAWAHCIVGLSSFFKKINSITKTNKKNNLKGKKGKYWMFQRLRSVI